MEVLKLYSQRDSELYSIAPLLKEPIGVQPTDIPKHKRKWSVVYALDEVFSVIQQSRFKKNEILVSLDLGGTISGRYSKETHHGPWDRILDEGLAQQSAIKFLEKLDKWGVPFFIHTALANTHQGELATYLIETSQYKELINPENSLLSAGYSKNIDENLTDTIQLVLHVDDSFVHIFHVLFALYKFPDVCIHGLFFPGLGDDQAEWTTQMTQHQQFLLETEKGFSDTCFDDP